MLSCLSRGWGSWSGDYNDSRPAAVTDGHAGVRKCKSALPRLGRGEEPIHRHGVTVSCRAKSASGSLRSPTPDGQVALPKTYLTRKGALLLFSSAEEEEYNPLRGFSQQYHARGTKSDLIDLSLNIGTLQRLTWSVLQYGDKSFDPTTSSVSDFQSKLFLKFLKTLPQDGLDKQAQPGGDLSVYLERLKNTTSYDRFSRLNTPDVQELKSALEALDRSRSATPVLDRQSEQELPSGLSPRPGTAPHLAQRHGSASSVNRSGVLSSDRLTSSLRSSRLIDRSHSGTPTAKGRYAWSASTETSNKTTDGVAAKILEPNIKRDLRKGSKGTQIPSGQGAASDQQGETTRQPSNSEHSSFEKKVSANGKFSSTEVLQTDVSQELSPLDPGDGVRELSSPKPLPRLAPDATLPTDARDPPLLEILTTFDESSENGDRGLSSEAASTTEMEEVQPFHQGSCEEDAEGHATEVRGEGQHKDERPLSPTSSTQTPGSVTEDGDLGLTVSPRTPGELAGGARSPSSGQAHITGGISQSRPASQVCQRDENRAPLLPPPSPVERPAPASSPVGFFEHEVDLETDENESNSIHMPEESRSVSESEELVQGSGDKLPSPTDGQPVNDEQTTVGLSRASPDNAVTTTTVFESAYAKSDISDTGAKAKDTASEPSVSSDMKIVVDIPRPGTTESVGGQATADLGQWTAVDRGRTSTPVSDNTDFKEQSLPDNSSDRTSVTSEKYTSSLHISQYHQYHQSTVDDTQTEAEEAVIVDDPCVGAVTPDTPYTSKSSLHAVRRGSPPIMPHPPQPSGREEEVPPTPLSPRPPTGSPPAKTHPYRKTSPKDRREVQPPASPDTLVRNPPSRAPNTHKDAPVTPPTGKPPTSDSKTRQRPVSTKRGKKSKPTKGKRKEDIEAERQEAEEKELAKRKLAIKVKQLEQQIIAKEILRREQMAEAEKLRREYQLQMEALEREAEELRQAEEDAKVSMEMTRKSQREDRQLKLKAELERKKLLAIQNREREKRMLESARIKEQEMLESIGDAEMRTSLISEMERNRDEEERLAQERFEEEMQEAEQLAENQEERMRELERQAEEEAMQRLLEEQEELEKKRRSILIETQRLDEEDEKLKKEMEEEQRVLDEERHRMEMEEMARLEQEAERLKEIQAKEQAEMERLRKEGEQRKLELLKHRHKNYDMRRNLEQIRSSQGITRPYIYSYFITWPRDIYEKPMGGEPGKKKRPGLRPKPKSAK